MRDPSEYIGGGGNGYQGGEGYGGSAGYNGGAGYGGSNLEDVDMDGGMMAGNSGYGSTGIQISQAREATPAFTLGPGRASVGDSVGGSGGYRHTAGACAGGDNGGYYTPGRSDNSGAYDMTGAGLGRERSRTPSQGYNGSRNGFGLGRRVEADASPIGHRSRGENMMLGGGVKSGGYSSPGGMNALSMGLGGTRFMGSSSPSGQTPYPPEGSLDRTQYQNAPRFPTNVHQDTYAPSSSPTPGPSSLPNIGHHPHAEPDSPPRLGKQDFRNTREYKDHLTSQMAYGIEGLYFDLQDRKREEAQMSAQVHRDLEGRETGMSGVGGSGLRSASGSGNIGGRMFAGGRNQVQASTSGAPGIGSFNGGRQFPSSLQHHSSGFGPGGMQGGPSLHHVPATHSHPQPAMFDPAMSAMRHSSGTTRSRNQVEDLLPLDVGTDSRHSYNSGGTHILGSVQERAGGSEEGGGSGGGNAIAGSSQAGTRAPPPVLGGGRAAALGGARPIRTAGQHVGRGKKTTSTPKSLDLGQSSFRIHQTETGAFHTFQQASLLGKGGNSEVWQCRSLDADFHHDIRLAIKFLCQEEFQREMKIIDHIAGIQAKENGMFPVVPVWWTGEVEGALELQEDHEKNRFAVVMVSSVMVHLNYTDNAYDCSLAHRASSIFWKENIRKSISLPRTLSSRDCWLLSSCTRRRLPH